MPVHAQAQQAPAHGRRLVCHAVAFIRRAVLQRPLVLEGFARFRAPRARAPAARVRRRRLFQRAGWHDAWRTGAQGRVRRPVPPARSTLRRPALCVPAARLGCGLGLADLAQHVALARREQHLRGRGDRVDCTADVVEDAADGTAAVRQAAPRLLAEVVQPLHRRQA